MLLTLLHLNIFTSIVAAIMLATVKSYDYVPEPDPAEIERRTWPGWAIAAHSQGWIAPADVAAHTSTESPSTAKVTGRLQDTLQVGLQPTLQAPLLPPYSIDEVSHHEAAKEALFALFSQGERRQFKCLNHTFNTHPNANGDRFRRERKFYQQCLSDFDQQQQESLRQRLENLDGAS